MIPCERPGFAERVPGLRACFLGRAPGIDADADRETVLARLASAHRQAADELGFAGMPFATATQVHGNSVAIVDAPGESPGCDGLVTSTRGVCLAIYVADCAAVFLADREGRACGLLHSGKKGTELGIARVGVRLMADRLGCAPANLLAWISPCIRPPHYETDFAATITRQLEEAGVGEISGPPACTASHPDRYYSYRREMGRTGRMLALVAIGS